MDAGKVLPNKKWWTMLCIPPRVLFHWVSERNTTALGHDQHAFHGITIWARFSIPVYLFVCVCIIHIHVVFRENELLVKWLFAYFFYNHYILHFFHGENSEKKISLSSPMEHNLRRGNLSSITVTSGTWWRQSEKLVKIFYQKNAR